MLKVLGPKETLNGAKITWNRKVDIGYPLSPSPTTTHFLTRRPQRRRIIFSDEVGLHPPASSDLGPRIGIESLDLNSQAPRFPHLEVYEGFLQSGRVDATMSVPHSRPRNGNGGGNRTLGLRASRSTGGGGHSDSSASGRLHQAPLPPVAPADRVVGGSMSLAPTRSGGRGGSHRGGRGGDDEDDVDDNDVEEVFHTPQVYF